MFSYQFHSKEILLMESQQEQCTRRTKTLTTWVEENFCKRSENDDKEITSTTLHHDILLNCLTFLDRHGLMEKEMKIYLEFFNILFTDTVCEGLPIEDAVNTIKERITPFFKEHGNFSLLFMKSAIDYIMSTVIQHYHLMVYVMNNRRDEELHVLYEKVEIPLLEPDLLQMGKTEAVVEMERKVAEEEMKYKLQMSQVNDQYESAKKKIEDDIDTSMATNDVIEGMTTSSIVNITSDVLHKYSELTATELQHSMEASKQLVSHKIEKAKITNSSAGGVKNLTSR